MSKNAIKIYFCYPDIASTNADEVADNIAKKIKSNNQIGFAGFEKKESLKKSITGKFSGGWSYKKTFNLDKGKIEKIALQSIKKCFRKLALRSSNIFVFIFPWTGEKYNKALGGVTGFTPFKNTLHIFISPEKFSIQALKETITHEYNHALFFDFHQSEFFGTLRDTLIFEGIAEVFTKEIIKNTKLPITHALNDLQSKKTFNVIKNELDSEDYSAYEKIFLGKGEYKPWAGYAIGYRIANAFRIANLNLSWPEIMQMRPIDIFLKSPFVKKME